VGAAISGRDGRDNALRAVGTPKAPAAALLASTPKDATPPTGFRNPNTPPRAALGRTFVCSGWFVEALKDAVPIAEPTAPAADPNARNRLPPRISSSSAPRSTSSIRLFVFSRLYD
jgi:hypothetical protein